MSDDMPELVGTCYTDGGEPVPHNVYASTGRCAICGQRITA